MNKYEEILYKLFYIDRNIVSKGNLDALNYIGDIYKDLIIHRFKSGTKFYDWEVPNEWTLNYASIKDSSDNLILNDSDHPFSVVFCSSNVKCKIKGVDLKERLHTGKCDLNDCIPYRQSTYENKWGFCVKQDLKDSINNDSMYFVEIDCSFLKGELLAGELTIPGETDKEIVLTSYICHPRQAHDGLSGVIMLLKVFDFLVTRKNKFTYRFFFFPETIGSICLLGSKILNPEKIEYALVSTCVGSILHKPVYKRTFLNNHSLDNLVNHLYPELVEMRNYYPYGSDERQLSSPGVRIPTGLVMGKPFGEFPEYHTDLDNLEFMNWEDFQKISEIYFHIITEYEILKKPIYLFGACEPMLGKRNLYSVIGNSLHTNDSILRNWILHLSDGNNTILDISIKSGFSVSEVEKFCGELVSHGIIKFI